MIISRPMLRRTMLFAFAIVIGIICMEWPESVPSSHRMLAQEPPPKAKNVPLPSQVVSGEKGYGNFVGQIILDGEPPKLPPVEIDARYLKDVEHVDGIVPNERLVVDAKSHGIKNVFIYLLKAEVIHPDLQKSSTVEIKLESEGCRFVPRNLIVRTDQTVLFHDEKSVGHNVHPNPLRSRLPGSAINPRREPTPVSIKVPERLPLHVKCDIHPWMTGWWLVLNHPYAAVTDETGKFRIDKLPAGDYRFIIWQEASGYLHKELPIAINVDQTTDAGKLKYTLDSFKLKW